MTIDEALKELQERPAVPVWPHYGTIMGMTKGQAYGAARRGDVDVVRAGRAVRVISASLRKQLKLDGAT